MCVHSEGQIQWFFFMANTTSLGLRARCSLISTEKNNTHAKSNNDLELKIHSNGESENTPPNIYAMHINNMCVFMSNSSWERSFRVVELHCGAAILPFAQRRREYLPKWLECEHQCFISIKNYLSVCWSFYFSFRCLLPSVPVRIEFRSRHIFYICQPLKLIIQVLCSIGERTRCTFAQTHTHTQWQAMSWALFSQFHSYQFSRVHKNSLARQSIFCSHWIPLNVALALPSIAVARSQSQSSSQ